MVQSLSPLADSLGKESLQLSILALLCLCHHLLAQMRSLEIGS
jgi:hypothetical protein